jgi:putative hydrolase of the HAD superfamily
MKYRAVIFDLFGTLVDIFSWSEYQRVCQRMAAALGVPYEDFMRLWTGNSARLRRTGAFANTRLNLEYICTVLDVPAEPTRVQEAVGMRLDYIRRALTPRSDAVKTLSRSKKAGLKTGLISNASPAVPAIWSETPLAPLVDVAVFSCEAAVEKPDHRIYELACERLRVSPQDCLYVGDGDDRELSGATGAGMRAVMIRAHYEDESDALRGAEGQWAGARISRLTEVLDLINDH